MWARLFDWFCYWVMGIGTFVVFGLVMLPYLMVRTWVKIVGKSK